MAEEDVRRSKKQKTGGFKWKDKSSADANQRDQPSTGLHRGYRNRSPRRDSYRERSPQREERDRPDDVSSRPETRVNEERSTEYRKRSPQRERQDDTARSAPRNTEKQKISSTTAEKFGLPSERSEKKDKPKKKPKSVAPSEPMIIVNINDRLGTKAAIPCLASDSVKAFKAIVAAHIGRQPHEIMLKRQGERPFKDQLTLEDYGVSNGVQLDLELDTGD